jgi:fatty acid/phospholipid biosynthesis enzyme
VCIICHGGSTPKAIRNAIREATKMVSEGVTQIIGHELQTHNGVKAVEQEA